MDSIWDYLSLVWIVILVLLLIPFIQRRILTSQRFSAIRRLEKNRQTKVITLIHRQERMNILGIPLYRYIDIEDSEALLRAIHMTPDDKPIDVVLHTPGGMVLASEQIASALKRHKGKVTIFIPHYAMSGGTLVALAADEIIMDPDAMLGPVDPQLGSFPSGYFPAASILKALEQPNPNRDDSTLILGDIAKKAMAQVYEFVYSLVKDRMPEERAKELATILSKGQYTHDYPIGFKRAEEIGLPVKAELPAEVHRLMSLYSQTAQRRTSVEFAFPFYEPPKMPPRDHWHW